ncbi:YczE/YyaS/YitT family protein [Rodentibacter caecimuris]|uniref:YitT family protein n=1 Tax=Rodentibacter caecimuris TaxID=1796644 RepID=A0ABX3KWY4_9PAST|nr:hypothetical protein BKG89_05905 [Rodentibacter heylii]
MKKIRVIPYTFWSAASPWTLESNSLLVLFVSLAVFGIGDGLLLLAGLGAAPWTVLSEGLALQSGLSVGWTSFGISCFVMLMWAPFKLRPGLGTLLNILIIALFLGITTSIIVAPENLFFRFLFVFLGILLTGTGSAFYLTCHQGAGPRDGLMVGLSQRFQIKIGVVRTLMEVTVCTIGFLMGGTVGISTLLFALTVGWSIQGCLSLIMRLPHSVYERNNLD